MIKDLKKDTEERMKKTIEALQTDLMSIRTGRATPALLDRVRVEYYGTPTPMNQIASVSAPEPRLLVVRPWDPGARPSHMFPVLDIDGDGRDELFLGERCIDIDTGADRWVADLEGYRGHSDIVMPTLDRASGEWSIYTCREFHWPEGSRGVVTFDGQGRERWGYRGMEHVHDGWTARLCDDGAHLCFALEIMKKSWFPSSGINSLILSAYSLSPVAINNSAAALNISLSRLPPVVFPCLNRSGSFPCSSFHTLMAVCRHSFASSLLYPFKARLAAARAAADP